MDSSSIINTSSSSSEQRWVDQMSRIFEKEVVITIIDQIPTCIFVVPKSMRVFRPEAYTPQLIGLGPYHHFHPDLYSQMPWSKLANANANANELVISFQHSLIDELQRLDLNIRACYDKFLDLHPNSLAWVMATDGLFLHRFILDYMKEIKDNPEVHPPPPPLPEKEDKCACLQSFVPRRKKAKEVDHSAGALQKPEDEEKKDVSAVLAWKNTVIRDIMMLENQIPIIVLRTIWKIDIHELLKKLKEFCVELSPLELQEESLVSYIESLQEEPSMSYLESVEHTHLLGLMYHLIVNNQPESMNARARLVIPNAVQVLMNLPWEDIFALVGKVKDNGFGEKQKGSINGTPQVLEIDIPSVSQLKKYAKIQFKALTKNRGIRDIVFQDPKEDDDHKLFSSCFDRIKKTFLSTRRNENDLIYSFNPSSRTTTAPTKKLPQRTLCLPVITLNENSEVILRNLVAYEILSAKPGAFLEFAQYVDLMSGIIDTVEDVKLLRDAGIIITKLSDDKVADIFNGMNKSTATMSESQALEKTRRRIVDYFYHVPMVVVYNHIMKVLRFIWKYRQLIGAVLLLALQVFQVYCDVYDCTRL